ncbi:hypothetical protein [Methylobacterium goesingense]|uniref:Secreted protein n=1 Tax=Methylobacterium goesingense TaxID=243690 RepID=A0ABV2L9Z4_9HYPH|nr:hypothetical protein [Methylobacterium goesingense]GJD75844.1 hypothetical protein CFIICLFH_4089 [Methylobacterium goesingense]
MRLLIACSIVAVCCTAAPADELNDMPDIACAQASSALERAQIGCSDANLASVDPRAGGSSRARSEDDGAKAN